MNGEKDVLHWRRSTRCANTNCVEVAIGTNAVYLRHTTDPDGLVLGFAGAVWKAFTDDLKAGRFDR